MENEIRMIADCHNHSTQSPDGKNTVREMAQRAVELGIEHYTITDHLEINKFYDEEFLYEEPVRESSVLVPQVIREFEGKLDMHYGVELGQPLHDMKLTERMLDSYDYEFIIGSCHMVKGWDDFYYLDYQKTDPYYLLGLYFDEVLQMAEWGRFDVLGHLTYPLRYIQGDFGIKIDMSRYENIIEEIFRTIVKNGMGIEINSSGLRQKIGVTMPDEHYVSLYKKCGGEIITVGSDAHRASDLGKGIRESISLAKKCGFDKIYYYKNRKPVGVNID